MTPPRAQRRSFDLVLVGGGLANGLIALAVLARQPSRSIAVVEVGQTLGGEHTWSFHASDIAPTARALVEPLVETSWSRQAVAFPEYERTLSLGYSTFHSGCLHRVVSERLRSARHNELFLERSAVEVEPHRVVLDDGSVLDAELVVDGRGPDRHVATSGCRFQKFVGLELELSAPSPIREPLLMDACVDQSDGLRFVYVLPYEPQRVLVEDTYFSDDSRLDDALIEARVLAYARERGYAVRRVLRRERGVLPLPLRVPPSVAREGLLGSGFSGGWFHPTTGYSVPLAVRLAEFVAANSSREATGPRFAALVRERNRQQRFCCMLNGLLYGAFAPEQRFSVMQRFYRLPEETIARFYALETTQGDRFRILCGRPPVGLSLKQAINQLRFQ